jgi:hypothetical protein
VASFSPCTFGKPSVRLKGKALDIRIKGGVVNSGFAAFLFLYAVNSYINERFEMRVKLDDKGNGTPLK